MGISHLSNYGTKTVEIDIDFTASSLENVIVPLDVPVREILRGRLWIDEDPGAGFSAWATITFFNKSQSKGEDAIFRTASRMVYTELAAATTGTDANINPDDHNNFSPNDLVTFLDDNEVSRLKTILSTMVAEDNVGVHAIDTGLSRVSEFSGFQLFNNEDGTDCYMRISFAATQTVSLKMELIIR